MSFTSRITSLRLANDNFYGESKDASSQLLELDKGLRSDQCGEQCEAIIRISKLIEDFPFPMLTTSAMLKLAEIFRIGSNFMRLQILHTLQQSRKHLDKITNTEEFLRCITTVTHSNDPVARALTLRLLAECASIFSMQKSVHHFIVNGLESHDSIEVDAAIYAADKYCQQSEEFSGSFCNKLLDFLEELSSPVMMKLKVLRVFQHMHHQSSTAKQAWDMCLSYLRNNPAQCVMVTAIHTLTMLSIKMPTLTHDQIKLLLEFLISDPRKSVRQQILSDLHLLALNAPHVWTNSFVELLCKYVLSQPQLSLRFAALDVLKTLSDDLAVCCFSTDKGIVCHEVCSQTMYDANPLIGAKALSVYANLTIHLCSVEDEEADSHCAQVLMGVQALLLGMGQPGDSSQLQRAHKMTLKAAANLCLAVSSQSKPMIEILVPLLTQASEHYIINILHCLLSINSSGGESLQHLTTEIVAILKDLHQKGNAKSDIMVTLYTLLFQVNADHDLDIKSLLFLKNLDCWSRYRIARSAQRYAKHAYAANIIKGLIPRLWGEQSSLFLQGLGLLSEGFQLIPSRVISLPVYLKAIPGSMRLLHQAHAAFSAMNVQTTNQPFRIDYLDIRISWLTKIVQLIKVTSCFSFFPPPAVAMRKNQHSSKYSYILTLLSNNADDLRQLYERMLKFYRFSFDADQSSLNILLTQQYSCLVLIYTIECLLAKYSFGEKSLPGQPSAPIQNVNIELRPLLATCKEVMERADKLVDRSRRSELGRKHMLMIQESAILLSQIPECIPRFFYQSLQHTEIKVTLDPTSSSSEPLRVHYDTQLNVTIEGVINQTCQTRRDDQKIQKVLVQIKSHVVELDISTEKNHSEVVDNSMKLELVPHNDFFKTSTLLAFPVVGSYSVEFVVSIEDGQACIWDAGPTMFLHVRAFDDQMEKNAQKLFSVQRSGGGIVTSRMN